MDELKGLRILVVEDDFASVALIKEFFKVTQADLVFAKTGNEILEQVHKFSFDLILMDINMPGMSGLEATKIIRSEGNDIPIIAQTAYAFENEKADCLKAGCNAYISKPFSENELFALIKDIIHSK